MENPDPDPDPDPTPSTTSIADVCDSLLNEIFLRLPCYETAITCSLVSKEWLTLISDPKFVIQFLDHKKEKKVERPWTFLSTIRLKTQDDHSNNNKEVLHSSPRFNFSWNFVPTPFAVVATFKDLILCITGTNDGSNNKYYHVCNPITKQRVALPPTCAPLQFDQSRRCFVCEDPYYDSDKGCIDYRFRIVVVPFPRPMSMQLKPPYDPFFTLKVTVFCSESWRWIDVDLKVSLCPQSPHPLQSAFPLNAVVCKGMVCIFYTNYLGLFNPFDVTPATSTGTTFVARPVPKPPLGPRYTVLECGGRLYSVTLTPHSTCLSRRGIVEGGVLRAVDEVEIASVEITIAVLDLNQVVNNDDDDDNNNNNNNDTQEVRWRWSKSMCVDDTGGSHSILSKIRMVNMHPTNSRLIYVLTDANKLLLCDRRSSCLKTLGELPPEQYHIRCHKRLELQCWPTPVPTIPNPITTD